MPIDPIAHASYSLPKRVCDVLFHTVDDKLPEGIQKKIPASVRAAGYGFGGSILVTKLGALIHPDATDIAQVGLVAAVGGVITVGTFLPVKRWFNENPVYAPGVTGGYLGAIASAVHHLM